jgi:hypothetical protein
MDKRQLQAAMNPSDPDSVSSIAMAKLWGITDQAVRAWGDKIPPLRVYQLKDSHPHLFKAKARRRAA